MYIMYMHVDRCKSHVHSVQYVHVGCTFVQVQCNKWRNTPVVMHVMDSARSTIYVVQQYILLTYTQYDV